MNSKLYNRIMVTEFSASWQFLRVQSLNEIPMKGLFPKNLELNEHGVIYSH